MKAIISLLLLSFLYASQANAVLWRLGAVSPNSLKIFATTGDTQKTIKIDVTGVGVFSKIESIWTDMSDGSPENTYYAVIEVNGLQPWTTYTYKILEDDVEKGGGSFRTLPDNQTTLFDLALIGCNAQSTDGLKDEIVRRSYLKGGGLIAIVHVDDLSYMDAQTVTDVEGITSTGPPRDTHLAYDYAAGWLISLKEKHDYQEWINHNIPTFWMWGDHEISNDYMNSVTAINKYSSGTREAGEHVSLDNKAWLAANAAFEKVAEATPSTFDGSSSVDGVNGKSYAYGFDVGPVRFFIHDRNSAGECFNCTPDVECIGKACGEIATHETYRENYGKTQLNHLKGWLDDSTHPFKVLFSGITVGGHSIVENQPWLSWWPGEYYNFESWIDANTNLNGTDGNFLFVAGDRHNFGVHKRSKASPHNGSANFMEYYVGTITGGGNNHVALPVGEIQNGCEVVYSESEGKGGEGQWLTIMSVSSTALKLSTMDRYHNEVFAGTLQRGPSNHFAEMTNGLKVIDITNPASTTLVTDTSITGRSVGVSTGVAYVTNQWKGINVVDITDPTQLIIDSVIDDIFAEDIFLSSNDMYVSGGWTGLHIYDNTIAETPVLSGSKSTVSNRYAKEVAIDELNNHAYVVTNGSPELQVFDVTDETDIQVVGWDDVSDANGIALDDGHVFVAGGVNGLQIKTKARPSPTVYTSVDTVQFSAPTDLPDGTYNLMVINPDGSTFKVNQALSLIATGAGTDTDGDGLTDSDETGIYLTDPDIADTDGDGLIDGDEVLIHMTDPLSIDSDNDGAQDNLEIVDGTNPLDILSFSTTPDGDVSGDGQVTITDLMIAYRIVLGTQVATNFQLAHGDVAPLVGGVPLSNGIFDSGDILILMRKLLNRVLF